MGNPNLRSQRLNGLFPLAYLGVIPVSPENFIIQNRPPTVNDSKNFYIGDIWLDYGTNTPPKAADIWMLVSLVGNLATWVNFGGGTGALTSLRGNDSVDVLPGNDTEINLIGNTANGIQTIGNAGTHTMTIDSTGGGPFGQTITGDSGGPVSPSSPGGNWNLIGNAGEGVTVVGNPGTNTLTINFTNSGTVAGLTGNTGGEVGPSAGNINVIGNTANGITVIGNPGTSTLTIDSTTGHPFLQSLTGNSGGTVYGDALQNINVVGDGTTAVVVGNPGTNTLTISTMGGGGTAGANAFFYYNSTTTTIPGAPQFAYLGAYLPLTKVFDMGNNVFPGNGAGTAASFTCPQNGLYQFSVNITCFTGNEAQVIIIAPGYQNFSTQVVTERIGSNMVNVGAVSVAFFLTAGQQVMFAATVTAVSYVATIYGNIPAIAGNSPSYATWISGYQLS